MKSLVLDGQVVYNVPMGRPTRAQSNRFGPDVNVFEASLTRPMSTHGRYESYKLQKDLIFW